MIHERDSPIISLDMMVIWLCDDGLVAHAIFEHEYLKYWKGEMISKKKESVSISKE